MTEEEKKQRHKEAMRKYYQRNKARLNAYATEYKTAHPESVQKSNAKYWDANKESINAGRRQSGKSDRVDY